MLICCFFFSSFFYCLWCGCYLSGHDDCAGSPVVSFAHPRMLVVWCICFFLLQRSVRASSLPFGIRTSPLRTRSESVHAPQPPVSSYPQRMYWQRDIGRQTAQDRFSARKKVLTFLQCDRRWGDDAAPTRSSAQEKAGGGQVSFQGSRELRGWLADMSVRRAMPQRTEHGEYECATRGLRR